MRCKARLPRVACLFTESLVRRLECFPDGRQGASAICLYLGKQGVRCVSDSRCFFSSPKRARAPPRGSFLRLHARDFVYVNKVINENEKKDPFYDST